MLLTLKDAARFLDLHPNTLYRLAQRKQIPAMRLGWKWRFDQTTLEHWISHQMTTSTRKAA